MKNNYSFILVALLLIVLFSCEKTENESNSDIDIDSLYFSCKVNGTDFLVNSSFGFGSICQRLYKLNNNKKDTFILGHFQEFSEGTFKIGFSKKFLLDTTFNFIDYNFNPNFDLKEQILQPGVKDISEILYNQEGFFIEYQEALQTDQNIDYYRIWTSYLKTYPEDELNTIVDKFQNNSSCEIVNLKKVGESGLYIEAVFNCILYDIPSGDTLELTEGNLKCIF